MHYTGIVLCCVVALSACTEEDVSKPLFESVLPEHSGVAFENTIIENDSLNILDNEYLYNGGGVALADFNNDGWLDIYFTGNMVSNKLYLNRGDFTFEDITEESGATGEGRWCAGVATIDINLDGWMDLYICTHNYSDPERRSNLLYINQGVNSDGIPTFKEQAVAYNIADTNYTMSAAFLDYDLDGDLDLFVIVNQMKDTRYPSTYRRKKSGAIASNRDRLYRNDWNEEAGHPVFSDVSLSAGIDIEGYSLGLSIVDINADGWPDIYVTNDFITNDILYVNNGDGTFSDRAEEYFKHTSHSAMGIDISDINNDGLKDVLVVDMLPEDNFRRKTMMAPNNYMSYVNNWRFGYYHQYVRNTFQLNMGTNPESGNPIFSDIALYSGIHATDWSWTPLVADFDNDAFKDIIITNGYPKDVTDRDFMDYQANVLTYAPKEMMLEKIPEIKLINYGFKNNRDLTFTNVSEEWGMVEPSYSNGAAFGDLDNDGDLDYVVNNINGRAFVFKNNLREHQPDSSHFLRLKLTGPRNNPMGVGATVYLHESDQVQLLTVSPYRGYLSSNECYLHFGLANKQLVDSLRIIWPDRRQQTLRQIPVNQVLEITYSDAENAIAELDFNSDNYWFKTMDDFSSLEYIHEERDFIDFNIQPLLPHKLSQFGPGITVGDVNNDGLDDFYVGGSLFYSGYLFIQQLDGTFEKTAISTSEGEKRHEELGVLLFDANNDGYDDLYLVSGGYEFSLDDSMYFDRFLINTGGSFVNSDPGTIPKISHSGSCIRAADFDRDGDLDLFIGGRVFPHQFPRPVDSYLLINELDEGKVSFRVGNDTHAPSLNNIGMVTDALWTDFNQDGWIDLILVGEGMPITFLKNEKGKLISVEDTGISNYLGWWNSINAGDFDRDGDIDYVAGNFGDNSIFRASVNSPVRIYGHDFDDNGGYDAILSAYFPDENGQLQEFPYHTRNDVMKQVIAIRDKFPLHKEFGLAKMDELFSEEKLGEALIVESNYMKSSFIENMGKEGFKVSPLPKLSQIAPVFGIHVADYNFDGFLDICMVGNDYGMEVTSGRCDAFNGLILKGQGNTGFETLSLNQSGFFVPGDAKALAHFFNTKGEMVIIASQNRDDLKFFTRKSIVENEVIIPRQMDCKAILVDNEGNRQIIELYYGSGFLSSSSRAFAIDVEKIIQVELIDYAGQVRKAWPLEVN